MIMMLKIIAIYNAILLGWSVTVDSDNSNKLIMRKKSSDMTEMDHDVPQLLEMLLEL
jgi:hypothetical protein